MIGIVIRRTSGMVWVLMTEGRPRRRRGDRVGTAGTAGMVNGSPDGSAWGPEAWSAHTVEGSIPMSFVTDVGA